jgi:CrcB protein
MAVDRTVQGAFPWGTFAVNMVGCFLFGLVYAAFEQRLEWPGDLRGIVLTGFMGAFTTYSTFAFNTADLIRESQYALAAANVIAQNVLGVALIFAGLALGRNI